MDSLVLSTLIFQILGIVVTVLMLALSSCLPARRNVRSWAAADTATRPAIAQETADDLDGATQLPHAA